MVKHIANLARMYSICCCMAAVHQYVAASKPTPGLKPMQTDKLTHHACLYPYDFTQQPVTQPHETQPSANMLTCRCWYAHNKANLTHPATACSQAMVTVNSSTSTPNVKCQLKPQCQCGHQDVASMPGRCRLIQEETETKQREHLADRNTHCIKHVTTHDMSISGGLCRVP